ncbi:GDP-mannose 4,6-dehydratase [Oleiharenicola sp. Vm1]|uniref:GDP-mannose 4,6-dehydratase n=1 Tax=Oleiharenicola sp. Vm1 TaxID=3398393 RepID=UPI0039F4EAA2
MASPTAFITGITGQDGSYLTELLLARGYVVHGLVRRASLFNRSRIEHLRLDPAIGGKTLFLHYGDLNDTTSLRRLFRRIRPGEVYHFAGQSHVGLSFEIPEATCHEVGHGTLGLLELLRDQEHPVRFYHASSSEVFGAPATAPQNEDTPLRPTSPYGCAKAFATNLCRVYREAYGLFICNGIAYNHESPRRGENFVTRKISLAAARIARGRQHELVLGQLDAARDWGYAPEFVEGMWHALQRQEPDDYVFATGESHTLAEFIDAAFATVGLDWRRYVQFDARYVRPIEPVRLVGDAAKAHRLLGWTPRTKMADLARLMVQADLALLDGAEPAR